MPRALKTGWLKDAPFDLTLIVGITALACAMGGAAAISPSLFLPLLLLHTWCFGFAFGTAQVAQVALPTALSRLDNISLNGTATLTSITGGPIDGSNLGPMAVSPQDSNTVYLVKAGFQDGQKIFKRTVDNKGNQSWTNITGSFFPNVQVNAIVVDPVHPSNIYIGTNLGAWGTTDGGVANEIWHQIGSGLPNVPVMQLTIANRTLVAATWGRGVWTLTLP